MDKKETTLKKEHKQRRHDTFESIELPETPEIILPEQGGEDKLEEFGISRVGD